MGIISLLIKIFFFYILFMIFSGLIKAYQTYKLVQKQAQDNADLNRPRQSYANNTSAGETIDAEFKVVGEKDV